MTATAILSATKTCTKCGECKPATLEFYYGHRGGLQFRCKVCADALMKIYRAANRDAILEKKKARREATKEARAAYSVIYRAGQCATERSERRKSYYAANKQKESANAKAYHAENKQELNARAVKYSLDRRASDPVFALKHRISSAIGHHLRVGGYTKKSRSHAILGCDWETFKTHIERQFLNGMSWKKMGEIHIDHIVPVATATTEEEVIALNHYTNLRPLWAVDNLRKSDTITHLI